MLSKVLSVNVNWHIMQKGAKDPAQIDVVISHFAIFADLNLGRAKFTVKYI